jgi:DNA repair exonuclease SbcCD ATPase subunit
MKKILALLLAAIMVLSVFTLAACNDEPGPNNQGNNSCTSHVDANTDYKCDNCGAELEKPACTEHEDADKNGKCDKCDAEVEEELTEDEQAAKDVIDRIEKIQEFTKKNYSKQKTNIDRARRDYDKLTDAQKALIPAEMLEKLTNAEARLQELKDAAAQAAADKKAADAVITMIDAIGEVTKESKDAIEAARTAYDALTDAQKQLVTNYDALTKAEEAYKGIAATGDNTMLFVALVMLSMTAMVVLVSKKRAF